MKRSGTVDEKVVYGSFFYEFFLNLFTISTCNYQLVLLYLRCIKSGKQ